MPEIVLKADNGVVVPIKCDSEFLNKIWNYIGNSLLDLKIEKQNTNGISDYVSLEKKKITVVTPDKIKMFKEIKIPNKEEIVDFIKQNSYTFIFSMVTESLMGMRFERVTENSEIKKVYRRIRSEIKKAKDLISETEKGKWKRVGTTSRYEAIYEFVKE